MGGTQVPQPFLLHTCWTGAGSCPLSRWAPGGGREAASTERGHGGRQCWLCHGLATEGLPRVGTSPALPSCQQPHLGKETVSRWEE